MTEEKLTTMSNNAGVHGENLTDHLRMVHSVISSRYPHIDRLARATYDVPTDTLKTFV